MFVLAAYGSLSLLDTQRGGALFCQFPVALTAVGGIDILIPVDETPTRPTLLAPRDHVATA